MYEGCGKVQVPLKFTIPLAVDLDLCVATGYCMCMVDYLCQDDSTNFKHRDAAIHAEVA